MSFVLCALGFVASAWAGGQSDAGATTAQPLRYRLSYILCATQAACERAAQRLRAGEAFELVAQQVSIDPGTRNKGGQIQRWARADEYTANFAAEVRRLKVGEVSERPVQTEFGWSLVRVDEVSDADILSVPEGAQALPNVDNLCVRPKPKMSKDMLAALSNGPATVKVTVKFVLQADGQVQQLTATSDSRNPLFDEASLAAARTMQCKPLLPGIGPLGLQYVYTFKLD